MTDAASGSGATMEELSPEECFQLLRTREVGRLGVNAEDHPLIVPVNYGVDGDSLVIRTHPGTMLAAAAHAAVSFEVDDIDQKTRSGWSVLARGTAEEVGAGDDADLVARTHAAGAQPWAPGEHGVWLRVTVQHVTGRRIVPGELPPPVDPRAYL